MHNVVVPSLEGRVALITGGNTGIGFVAARELARAGARVTLACRSVDRAGAAAEQIRASTGRAVDVLALDLGDLGSVRRAAEQFLSTGSPLHLLINNGGIAGLKGLSASGFEVAFGVNHVGHFLLTMLLLPRLRESAPARIVTVASRAHRRCHGIRFEQLQKPTRTLLAIEEYAVSKLANILFSQRLGELLAGSGVTTYSLHPGVVATEVWRYIPVPLQWFIRLRPMITPEEGARTTLYCATAPELASQTGLYYSDCQITEPHPQARDAAVARELWRRSVEWTGEDVRVEAPGSVATLDL